MRLSQKSLPYCLVVLVCLSQSVLAVRKLRFASPLQSLTIWDPQAKRPTPRDEFRRKYEAGLKAEAEVRRAIAAKKEELKEASGDDWAAKAAEFDRRTRRAQDELLEQAFDKATASAVKSKSKKEQNPNQYQFVGVVKSNNPQKPITWYARKKPANANWSVRLVHVNKGAIIQDLFQRGKVDIFAKYDNTGDKNPETNTPVIRSQYSVRERSWRTLWNFSPKHLFSDSSGMYWRERRLKPGMYTDGNMVYEASYRYRDGRNGMHRKSSFSKYLSSKGIDSKQKERIVKRLAQDSPDVVLEE